MRGKRLLLSIGLLLIPGSFKRASFLRRQNVFAHMGEYCSIQKRKLPLYPKLISIGNNVHIASGVSFLTHDITHVMLNRYVGAKRYRERVGCIEIGDNVFIGSSTRILYDVKIGSNVIVGAGSTVTKDIPDNSIVAGVPARVIGTFDDYLKKRDLSEQYPASMTLRKQEITDELAKLMWQAFDKKRSR